MKALAKSILVILVAVLLTACAASEPRTAQSRFNLADVYMQAVERNARTKGIDVVWINAPSRSQVKEDESSGG